MKAQSFQSIFSITDFCPTCQTCKSFGQGVYKVKWRHLPLFLLLLRFHVLWGLSVDKMIFILYKLYSITY